MGEAAVLAPDDEQAGFVAPRAGLLGNKTRRQLVVEEVEGHTGTLPLAAQLARRAASDWELLERLQPVLEFLVVLAHGAGRPGQGDEVGAALVFEDHAQPSVVRPARDLRIRCKR